MKYLMISVFILVFTVANAAFGECGCGCGKKDGPVVVDDEEVMMNHDGFGI